MREITRFINIVEIDLLDVSSLINYEIIQVDKMVIDIKEQLESGLETVPVGYEEVRGEGEVEGEESAGGKMIREFIHKRFM